MVRLMPLLTVLIDNLKKNGNKTAIIWVGDDPADYKKNILQRITTKNV